MIDESYDGSLSYLVCVPLVNGQPSSLIETDESSDGVCGWLTVGYEHRTISNRCVTPPGDHR